MKKLLVMAAMVLSSVGAFAQYEKGDFTIQPKVGLSAASTTGNGAQYKAGFVGGVEGEYHASSLFGLSVGVLYSMEGAKVKDSDEKYNLNYINVPILANFYVAEGLAIKAGIQPAYNVSKKYKDGHGNSYDLGNIEKAADKLNIDFVKVKSFAMSIPVGISYEYANFCLDARYNIGVTNIFDGENADAKSSVFQLTLGYKFKL